VPRADYLTLASGLRLSYHEHGAASGPAVVLLPGPTDSWRSYEPVLTRLSRGIRAIAVSARGHGDSDKPDDGYAVEDFAGDVVEVLDALGSERVVLVGHSGSCLAARRVALDHPERVAGLVLEASPTSLNGEPALRDFVNTAILRLSDPIDPEFARAFLVDTASEHVAPEIVGVLVEDILKVPARVWHALFEALICYDDTTELTKLAAPTLLIWGDGDSIVSRAMQDDLVGRIPTAELIVYPGVGHAPRLDDPQRFSDDLSAFVERVQSRP
jgi:pimeloyl-ACP methyl ester carboxylesterase